MGLSGVLLGGLQFTGIVLGAVVSSTAEDLTQWVDPLIGTAGAFLDNSDSSGNVFPGAAVPFGVVKIGIDTAGTVSPAVSENGGYSPAGNVTAISLMHESGTGGEPKYGVVPQMPLVGDLDAQGINIANNRTYQTGRTSDTARVAHWTSVLKNGIQLDLTASQHAAIARYSFPASGDKHILVDLGHILPSPGSAFSQVYLQGGLSVDQTSFRSYSGFADYEWGWGRGTDFRIFFCGEFNTAFSNSSGGMFAYGYDPNHTPASSPTLSAFGVLPSVNGTSNTGVGALFTWPGNASQIVESRIGLSFISVDRACSSIQSEVPWTQSFNDTVNIGKKTWNDEVLGSVVIPDDGSRNQTLLRMLYTGLYYTALLPSNRTGENPKWESSEPSYDDFYTLWDIFRCLTPWYHLVHTPRYIEMLRSMVDIFVHDGYYPDGRSGNVNGLVQGGSNADTVLGDAFVKGLDKAPGLNWSTAWEGLVKDAEVSPPSPVPISRDDRSFDGGNIQGRGAIDDWVNIGWITRNHSRCISRAVEYAQNDFAISNVARGLGKTAEASKYRKRSMQWENMWNANFSSDLPNGIKNFKGFLVPRDADGTFNLTGTTGAPVYSATGCGECYWNSDTYEALPYEYSFNVPHDVANLIDKMGGSAEFIRRLDTMFIPGLSSNHGGTAGDAIFNPGNEPSFLTPFLYNYVPGSQWRTVNQTRNAIDRFYSDKTNGIPGNSDAGAMQSWMIWNLVGLFPVTGQPVYLLHAPHFKAADIRLLTPLSNNSGAKPALLQIRAPDYNITNFWPQGITFNGKKLKRTYLLHSEIENGGTIEWDMGPEPSEWDKNFIPPPSLSTGGL